jgi:uncharacterized protein (TIGR00369 family)
LEKPTFIPYTAGPFLEYLGVNLVSRADGRAHIWVDVQDWMKNRAGFVHGGILATLADVAAAQATISTFADRDQSLVTTDMHVTFLEPVNRGAIEGFGEVLHRGRSLVRVRARLRTAGRGRDLLEALATFMLLPPAARE